MTTIRDVSALCGVSITTISRYLSNDSNLKIQEATKVRIDNAIKELNYIPRPRNTHKEKLRIGVILAHTSQKYSDPFFSTILLGIEESCEKNNVSLALVYHCNDLDKKENLHTFCNSQLDGAIIMENMKKDTLNRLQECIPNIVLVDQYNPEYNNVGIDHFNACKKVMHCFIKNGYQRIAYIGGSVQNVKFEDSYRTIAYREALRRADIPFDPSIFINCNWDINLCAQLTKKMLLSSNPPDAIFAGSDTLASVILGVLHELNLKCPQDIGLIGFNGLEISQHYAPALTTLKIPMVEIGVASFQRLLRMMLTGDTSPVSIMVPTQLIIRNSILLKEDKKL